MSTRMHVIDANMQKTHYICAYKTATQRCAPSRNIIMVTTIDSSVALNNTLANSQQVVLHFFAPWSEPCKHMDSILEELARIHSNVSFVRVDAEQVVDVSEKYQIISVPCVLFFKVVCVGWMVSSINHSVCTSSTTLYRVQRKWTACLVQAQISLPPRLVPLPVGGMRPPLPPPPPLQLHHSVPSTNAVSNLSSHPVSCCS